MGSAAVVILNYNGEKLLQQFLPSVIQYSQEASIYVVDNGSTDNSVTVVERGFPSVKIIHLPENYGYCKGYNEALQCIDTDIAILLNSDIEVTANWLTPILSLFDSDPLVAAVQPKILSYRSKNEFEYAGAGGGFIDSLGYPFCRGRIFAHIEEDNGQYNDICEIFWASGACFAVRSNVYKKLNGFDEDFFAHMEEVDLCWRIHRTNQKVCYCGLSTVYHLGAATLAYESPRKTFLNFRNNLWMLFKNFSATELAIKIPVRLVLDWLASLAFLLKGQSGNAGAVLRSHLAVIGSLRTLLGKRRQLIAKYPVYAPKMIYRGMILVDYLFKRGKIKFPG